MTQQSRVESKPAPSRRKRRTRVALALLLLLLGTAWGVPRLLSSSLLRDEVVNASLAGLQFRAEADQASFGWFPPTRVAGLRVASTDDQVNIEADELRLSQAWWQLALFSDRIGHVDVQHPRFALLLDPNDQGRYSLEGLPAFTARLEDAEFELQLLSMDEPVIAVSGLNIGLGVVDDPAPCLVVDRGRLFDHRPLTPQLCGNLLQLVDPTLADVVEVDGSFSLDVERLRMPLDVDPDQQKEQADFEGRLHLHHVSARVKTPLLKRVLRVAADVYAQQPADVIRVVENNTVHLEMRQGRIFHDRLTLGFPEISPELEIHSRGSVGLDESLDLWFVVPEVFVAEDASQADPQAAVYFHVTGTLEEPQVERVPAPPWDEEVSSQ